MSADTNRSVIVMLVGEIPAQVELGITNILVLGALETQPDLSAWPEVIGKFDKVFLFGRKAFSLFMPPYIEVENATTKTTYCPDQDGLVETIYQYINGLPRPSNIIVWVL